MAVAEVGRCALLNSDESSVGAEVRFAAAVTETVVGDGDLNQSGVMTDRGGDERGSRSVAEGIGKCFLHDSVDGHR